LGFKKGVNNVRRKKTGGRLFVENPLKGKKEGDERMTHPSLLLGKVTGHFLGAHHGGTL